MPLGKGTKRVLQLAMWLAVVVVAVVFVWQLSAQYSQSVHEARLQTLSASPEISSDIPRMCGRPVGPEFVRCVVTAVESRRDSRRSEEDLAAQRQMADWAFWMVVVNALTM